MKVNAVTLTNPTQPITSQHRKTSGITTRTLSIRSLQIPIRQPHSSPSPPAPPNPTSTMSRSSPADPTLFTSTTPHASAKPSTVKIGGRAPPNETPQQKVARLREAARRAKEGQKGSFDKVVARGRVWADRAHKFTPLSLIGFTGKYFLSRSLGGDHRVFLGRYDDI